MRKYLVNLTDNLIGKHRFDAAAGFFGRQGFFGHVKSVLELEDVAAMNPETMGRIMASFDYGDMPISKQELFSSLHFGGDAGALFRELVAVCLAHAIDMRFHAHEAVGLNIPAYCRRKENRVEDRG